MYRYPTPMQLRPGLQPSLTARLLLNIMSAPSRYGGAYVIIADRVGPGGK